MRSSPNSRRDPGIVAAALVAGMRPEQWPKNLLVFAAPVAGGMLGDLETMGRAVAAFALFCIVAGGLYLVNDARDVAADRLHPTKRRRPVAAGYVSIRLAWGVGLGAVAGGVAGGMALSTGLGLVLATYVALSLAYSLGLKRVPVVELGVVSAGFILRAGAGAAVTGVPLSAWFFIVTSAGALLMITAKREAELARCGDSPPTRAVLAEYTPAYLASVRSVAVALALVAYCLWAFEGHDPSGWLVRASAVPFALAVLRYSLLAERGEGERPERLVVTDPVLIGVGAVWAATYLLSLYGW